MVLQDNIPLEKPATVQRKTIINHVEHPKSFVYQDARWADPATKTQIEIPIEPRANGRAICSACGKPAPGYDVRLGGGAPRRQELEIEFMVLRPLFAQVSALFGRIGVGWWSRPIAFIKLVVGGRVRSLRPTCAVSLRI